MHIFHVPPLSQFLLGAGPRPGGRAFTLEQPPVNAAIKCQTDWEGTTGD